MLKVYDWGHMTRLPSSVSHVAKTWVDSFLTLVLIFHQHFTFWRPRHNTSVGFYSHLNCYLNMPPKLKASPRRTRELLPDAAPSKTQASGPKLLNHCTRTWGLLMMKLSSPSMRLSPLLRRTWHREWTLWRPLFWTYLKRSMVQMYNSQGGLHHLYGPVTWLQYICTRYVSIVSIIISTTSFNSLRYSSYAAYKIAMITTASTHWYFIYTKL